MSTTQLSREDQITIGRMARALDAFRVHHPEMPAQMVMTFLFIAQKPGISFRELMQRTGLGKSSISRNVAVLGSTSYRLGSAPLNLVETYDDPEDRRNKLARPTIKGRRLINDILATMKGGA